MKTAFKIVLKILFAPVIALLWLLSSISFAVIHVSGVVLSWLSVLFVLFGTVYLIEDDVKNGIIGLVIAYLISPYGLPMLAVSAVGVIMKMRFILQDRIYG